MRKLFNLIIALSLLFFLISMTNCGGGKKKADGTVELKLGHVLDINHPVHKAMEKWSDLVKKRSEGKVKIKIYPGGQLGMEKELVEQLQMSTLDITKISSAALEQFIPEMKIFGMPYLFKDNDHKWKVLNGPVGKDILDACQKRGLIGLGYYEAGSRSFYTKNTPIRTPEDLKNLKIRVMKSPIAIELLKTLGASPTPISWGELYTALQQGTVDGAENNPPSFVSARHYEVCKYYSLDKHSSPLDVVLFSKSTWKKLSDKNKKLIKDTFQESVKYQRKLWAEVVEDNFATLDSVGVEIIEPDLSKFREKVQPIYNKYSSEPVFGKYIKKIRNIDMD